MPNYMSDGGISFQALREFISGAGGEVGLENISMSSLMIDAQAQSVTLNGGDFSKPHSASEFYSMSYSSQEPMDSTPAICKNVSNPYVLVNGSYQGNDMDPGSFCAIHNPGIGFTSTTLANALAQKTSHTILDCTYPISYSSSALDGDGRITSLCVNFGGNCNPDLEDDDNGQEIRHLLFAIGTDESFQLLSSNNGAINHSSSYSSNFALSSHDMSDVTQSPGVNYAIIEIYGNSSYQAD
tara:strand:- start:3132 stop:3851 length:720 start_codon:yes stop_codon:yes gene_type:complete